MQRHLFYTPRSCAMASIIVMEWIGEAYWLTRVTREERQGERFRAAFNPHGQVPVYFHDGRVLCENGAILTLLADEAPQEMLVPESRTNDRYRVYQWLYYLDSGFHGAFFPWFKPGRYATDEADFPKIKAAAQIQIEKVLHDMNAHLDDKDHIILERRTILDAYVFVMSRWAESMFDYPSKFPRLDLFMKRMAKDPGVKLALAIEAGEHPRDSALEEHVSLDDAIAQRLRC